MPTEPACSTSRGAGTAGVFERTRLDAPLESSDQDYEVIGVPTNSSTVLRFWYLVTDTRVHRLAAMPVPIIVTETPRLDAYTQPY